MNTNFRGIQQSIRERFYKHTSGIPCELASHRESMIEDTDIDHGAPQLLLELIPMTEQGCTLKLYVNESFCQGVIGQFGWFSMIPEGLHGQQEVSHYPESAEQMIKIIVYGYVYEKAWYWRGVLLRSITNAIVDEHTLQISSRTNCLWWIHRLLIGVTLSEWHYEPYISNK